MAKFEVDGSESISFEQAIAFTQSLLAQMEAGELGAAQLEAEIAALVKSKNGARGFFVSYLSDPRPLADRPAPEVIRALQSAPEMVSELLVKNLAMSTAMAITHRRQGNEDKAQGSDRVLQRTINLIEQVQLKQVQQKLQELQTSATTGEGSYQHFLQRWGYDQQQRQAIAHMISQVS